MLTTSWGQKITFLYHVSCPVCILQQNWIGHWTEKLFPTNHLANIIHLLCDMNWKWNWIILMVYFPIPEIFIPQWLCSMFSRHQTMMSADTCLDKIFYSLIATQRFPLLFWDFRVTTNSFSGFFCHQNYIKRQQKYAFDKKHILWAARN